MGVPQVAVTAQPLDIGALVVLVGADGDGAVVTFAGLVRDHNQGRRVRFLEYEAYEPLAVRALQRIVDEARGLWPDARLAAHHRIGRLDCAHPCGGTAPARAAKGEGFPARV